uniref:Uncharacterized protein n=1 Tax=Chenopodium quinoa TaxID=63459 RepID=A0A803MTY0_CHEQI
MEFPVINFEADLWNASFDDDDYNVKGSFGNFNESSRQKGKFKLLRRRRSFVDNFSLSDFVNGNGVVKLWDGLSLGVVDVDNAFSFLDYENDKNSENRDLFFAGVPAVSSSPAVFISGGKLGLDIWDFRAGDSSPVVKSDWRRSDRRGEVVGMDSGRTGKVYVRDDDSMRLAVGDVRKVDAALTEEYEEEMWWDADGVTESTHEPCQGCSCCCCPADPIKVAAVALEALPRLQLLPWRLCQACTCCSTNARMLLLPCRPCQGCCYSCCPAKAAVAATAPTWSAVAAAAPTWSAAAAAALPWLATTTATFALPSQNRIKLSVLKESFVSTQPDGPTPSLANSPNHPCQSYYKPQEFYLERDSTSTPEPPHTSSGATYGDKTTALSRQGYFYRLSTQNDFVSVVCSCTK